MASCARRAGGCRHRPGATSPGPDPLHPGAWDGHGARRAMSDTITEGIRITVQPASGPSAARPRTGSSPSPTPCEIVQRGHEQPRSSAAGTGSSPTRTGTSRRSAARAWWARQPRLAPGERFEYTSWAMLRTPFGTMRGSYPFERPDGSQLRGADRRVRAHPAQRAALMDPAPQGVLLVNLGTARCAGDRSRAPLPARVPERSPGARHLAGRPRGAALRDHPSVPPGEVGRGLPEDLDEGGLAAARARASAGGSGCRTRSAPHGRWSSGCGTGVHRSARRSSACARAGLAQLTVVPLYPQYASSSTGSSLERGLQGRGRGLERGDAARAPAVLRRAGLPRCLRRRGAAGAGRGAAGPRALQLPRAARAPGEEERPIRGALPGARRLLRRAGRRRTAGATGRSASSPRGRWRSAWGSRPRSGPSPSSPGSDGRRGSSRTPTW